jgi:UDP-N-acetylglucosamine acyltransferase
LKARFSQAPQTASPGPTQAERGYSRMTIHASAVIDPRAVIHPTATLGPHVVIDGPATIGADCELGASAVVLGHTTLGAGCRVHAHAVIGGEPQDRKFTGAPSYTRIGPQCIIREGVTIHRGTAPGSATTVGARCLLMTNSHIGHNCTLADDVILVSGALLGGHVEIGPRAMISGNAAIHQFCRVGELALVGILARITQDVPPFFLTDQQGAVIGENRVGMTRAGLSPEERREIKAAFRVIYRAGIGRSAAIEYLAGAVTTAAGRRLLEFMAGDSQRGVATRSPNSARAA